MAGQAGGRWRNMRGRERKEVLLQAFWIYLGRENYNYKHEGMMGNSGIWSCWQTERCMESEDKSGNVEECWSRFQKSGRRKDGGEKNVDGRGVKGEHFHVKVGESTHFAILQYIVYFYIKEIHIAESIQCWRLLWPFLYSKWVDHRAVIHRAK